MTNFLHHYIHGHPKIHYTEMSEMYISLSLRALAMGVGGIFVPLFLYDTGFTLVMIAGFYVFAMSIRYFLEFLAAEVISRIGTKHTMTIGFAALLLHFLALYGMQIFPWLWVLAAVFLAAEMAFFWISYHLHMSSIRTQNKASSQISTTIILRKIFLALGPLFGGLIAAAYGVGLTLLLASACLLFAAYPLFKTPDTHKPDFDRSKLNLRVGKDGIAHMGRQISGVVSSYMWPLWLLIVLGSYSEIGFIIALSVLVGITLTFWVGRMGDRGYNDVLLKIGAGFKSLAHLLRIFTSNFGLALSANVSNELGNNFSGGPYTEEYFEAADQGDRFLYILRTNILAVLGKVLGWMVLLGLLLVLSETAAFQSMFALAAVCITSILWVSHRSV